MDIVNKKGIKHYVTSDIIHSVEPCTAYFGLGYWSYMIPPFRPENVLILGYGAGTTAGLIRKIYGPDVMITGVDKERIGSFTHGEPYANNLVIQDVYEYLRNIKEGVKYDFVIVDVFDGKDFNHGSAQGMFEEEALDILKGITGKMIAFNIEENRDPTGTIAGFFDFYVEKLVAGNRVLFFIPKGAEKMFNLVEIYNS